MFTGSGCCWSGGRSPPFIVVVVVVVRFCIRASRIANLLILLPPTSFRFPIGVRALSLSLIL